MSFRTRRVLVMTPFYMLFEFFLLKYTFSLLFDIGDIFYLIATLFIGGIYCLPMLFEAKKSRFVTRLLSKISGVWMWASVMFLIDILIIYILGNFFNLSQNLIIAMLAVVPILGICNYYNAHKLVVKEKIIYLDNLNEEMDIVQLSDVHFGSVRHKKIISQITDKLNQLDSCKLAVISGDLADGSCVVEDDDFKEFENVKMPVVFTPGNHDFYPGIENVITACKNAGIIVLDNENMEFEGLNIYGLTYSFGDIEIPTLDEIKSKINPDLVNLMVYHVPYYFDEFSKLGFDIQLSGHTHGGQFYPVVWIANRMFEYNMGLFKNDNGSYISTTTGVGSMDTPMRWGTNSELVVLKLRKNK